MDPEVVLTFWFDGDESRWWRKDPAFDAEVRERFGAWVDAAASGDLDGWLDTPRSALALVILLDQFTRNLHRDSGAAWSNDPKALVVAEAALARSHDRGVSHRERLFLYMPFMHAEDLAAQDRCVALFEAWVEEARPDRREQCANNLAYAHQHRDIVARFGRYPHRNAKLGRPSTPAEIAFLQQPGSSF